MKAAGNVTQQNFYYMSETERNNFCVNLDLYDALDKTVFNHMFLYFRDRKNIKAHQEADDYNSLGFTQLVEKLLADMKEENHDDIVASVKRIMEKLQALELGLLHKTIQEDVEVIERVVFPSDNDYFFFNEHLLKYYNMFAHQGTMPLPDKQFLKEHKITKTGTIKKINAKNISEQLIDELSETKQPVGVIVDAEHYFFIPAKHVRELPGLLRRKVINYFQQNKMLAAKLHIDKISADFSVEPDLDKDPWVKAVLSIAFNERNLRAIMKEGDLYTAIRVLGVYYKKTLFSHNLEKDFDEIEKAIQSSLVISVDSLKKNVLSRYKDQYTPRISRQALDEKAKIFVKHAANFFSNVEDSSATDYILAKSKKRVVTEIEWIAESSANITPQDVENFISLIERAEGMDTASFLEEFIKRKCSIDSFDVKKPVIFLGKNYFVHRVNVLKALNLRLQKKGTELRSVYTKKMIEHLKGKGYFETFRDLNSFMLDLNHELAKDFLQPLLQQPELVFHAIRYTAPVDKQTSLIEQYLVKRKTDDFIFHTKDFLLGLDVYQIFKSAYAKLGVVYKLVFTLTRKGEIMNSRFNPKYAKNNKNFYYMKEGLDDSDFGLNEKKDKKKRRK